jgi:hypothetical protein
MYNFEAEISGAFTLGGRQCPVSRDGVAVQNQGQFGGYPPKRGIEGTEFDPALFLKV